MKPLVIRPNSDADSSPLWAFYGATQLLEMLGVSYDTVSEEDAGGEPPAICLDPARSALGINMWPGDSLPPIAAPTQELCDVKHEVSPETDPFGFLSGCRGSLPLFGPVGASARKEEVQAAGMIRRLADGEAVGSLVYLQQLGGKRLLLRLGGRMFETAGLYLSRYSWPGRPEMELHRFVRQIDDIWDDALRHRWGTRPVVSEYAVLLANLLAWCFGVHDLPLVTAWPHPFRDGQVKRHGMIVSHDVDQVYADAKFREADADQTTNPSFNFEHWRHLEDSLGVKSVFFFMSLEPGRECWCTPGYSIADEPVREAAIELAQRGWEVSIHQLGYESTETIASELAVFEAATGYRPTGTRHHNLKHLADTLLYKQNAGLVYDTTWYAEQTESSFLCGSVMPFYPLECATGQPLRLVEFPFVIEDGIVFEVYGEGLARSVNGAVGDGRRALDHVLRHNGYACFNWHQRTFARMSAYEGSPANWTLALEKLIRYFQQSSEAWWCPLPVELAEWWGRRGQVEVEVSAGGVAVTNAGEEDVDELVIAVHSLGEAPIVRGLRGEALAYLGPSGCRERWGIPAPAPAGASVSIELE